MGDLIDISVPLRTGMPIWPGSVGFRLERLRSLDEGDSATVSRLDLDVHTGTHVDAPLHSLRGGATVDSMELDILVGPAYVARLDDRVDIITASVLDEAGVPEGTERLLLRTRNSGLWSRESPFQPDYVALSPDAAQWVVDRGIRLLGVDYLSVQVYKADPVTHEILLERSVVILEGADLSGAEPGMYELFCLPLRLVDAEGSPARAILRRIQSNDEL